MESRMLLALGILVVFSVVVGAKKCPQTYAKFTPQHSFCLDPNPKCTVLKQGVDNAAIQEILKAHNKLRSKVATGQEKAAGGLPTASNMLQMEWDPELAAVAQGWANQCVFNHDCKECRRVDRFKVGQNAAIQMSSCTSNACIQPEWESRIEKFYSEVKDFKKNYISPFVYQSPFGHFSQVVWAESSKVGCGYVAYKGTKWATEKLYICNYGPAGNFKNDAMYKTGAPCSACPANTKCKGSFPGLCTTGQTVSLSHVNRLDDERSDILLDCNSTKKSSLCKIQFDNNAQWNLISPPIVQVKSGSETSLKLSPSIRPRTSGFCLRLFYQKGPADGSAVDSSRLILVTTRKNERKLRILDSKGISAYLISYSWNMETQIELRLLVPQNAPDHTFNIQEVSAREGQC